MIFRLQTNYVLSFVNLLSSKNTTFSLTQVHNSSRIFFSNYYSIIQTRRLLRNSSGSSRFFYPFTWMSFDRGTHDNVRRFPGSITMSGTGIYYTGERLDRMGANFLYGCESEDLVWRIVCREEGRPPLRVIFRAPPRDCYP